jgi:CBS domain-containing protein
MTHVVIDDTIYRDRDQLLSLPVEKMMSRGAVTVGPETPIAEIADLMLRQNVRRVFVVHDGQLIGIITRNDIVRWLVSHVDASAAP